MIPQETKGQTFVEAFIDLFFFLPFAIVLLPPFEVTRVYQGLLRVTKGYQGLTQVNSG